jgi:hypothetical protein
MKASAVAAVAAAQYMPARMLAYHFRMSSGPLLSSPPAKKTKTKQGGMAGNGVHQDHSSKANPEAAMVLHPPILDTLHAARLDFPVRLP